MNTHDTGDALSLPHGTLPLPAYLPDATYGFVRSTDASDLNLVGVPGIVMNVFHLMQKPGSSVIHALGGLHAMAGWSGPIVTDSGGFQAYSLIHRNAGAGRISDHGLLFRPQAPARKLLLTPEKSVQLQLAYGSDVVMCLDECTPPELPSTDQRKAVERTVRWAAQSREVFDRLLDRRKTDGGNRPVIFGVVQGGTDPDLRRRCAEALMEIGFDGYGYGGWPLDEEGALLEDMLALTRSFIPAHLPMHALGVGHPESILACVRQGYGLFDSALPTRDARRGRLYRFSENPDTPEFKFSNGWFDRLYIQDKKHIRQKTPLSPYCDCPVCLRYPAGYLHHLFTMQDTLYYRLATLHNLRFMTRLMRLIASRSPQRSAPRAS
ncbi:MAG: tRNA-guanine transglycosylase [candidate division Zixibacteria bacterium]|nr:tRNA-guanine transglycosylase [candidate division Zixibacteria bacterium]